MFLLIAVINEEELLDELITGWLDIGITGATVIETTDLLQLISHHIPIFAGFRTLNSGGMTHNKTIHYHLDWSVYFLLSRRPNSMQIAKQSAQILCLSCKSDAQGAVI